MKAYVAIQSKLLKLMYTLWKNESIFDPLYRIQNNKEINIEKSSEKADELKSSPALDSVLIERTT